MPGKPQQNGRHERMYRTLKQDTATPVAFNLFQQQEKCDQFLKIYNNEISHQNIANKYLAVLYTPSTRIYKELPDIDYPFADRIVTITTCSRICMDNKNQYQHSVCRAKSWHYLN